MADIARGAGVQPHAPGGRLHARAHHPHRRGWHRPGRHHRRRPGGRDRGRHAVPGGGQRRLPAAADPAGVRVGDRDVRGRGPGRGRQHPGRRHGRAGHQPTRRHRGATHPLGRHLDRAAGRRRRERRGPTGPVQGALGRAWLRRHGGGLPLLGLDGERRGHAGGGGHPLRRRAPHRVRRGQCRTDQRRRPHHRRQLHLCAAPAVRDPGSGQRHAGDGDPDRDRQGEGGAECRGAGCRIGRSVGPVRRHPHRRDRLPRAH